MAGRQAAAFPPTDTHTARCSVLSIPPRAPLSGLGTCLAGLPQPVGHHAVAGSLVLSSVAIESCCPWLELPVPDTGSMSSTTNSSFAFSLFCPGPWRFHYLIGYGTFELASKSLPTWQLMSPGKKKVNLSQEILRGYLTRLSPHVW